VVANSTLQYLQLVSVRVLDIEVSRAVAIFLYRAKRNAPRRENLRSILEVLAVEEIIAFQALTVVFSLREAHEVDSGMFLVILELANDCVLDIVPIAYIDVSSRANLEPKFLTVQMLAISILDTTALMLLSSLKSGDLNQFPRVILNGSTV
jgi:hypothetical protein